MKTSTVIAVFYSLLLLIEMHSCSYAAEKKHKKISESKEKIEHEHKRKELEKIYLELLQRRIDVETSMRYKDDVYNPENSISSKRWQRNHRK